MRAARQAGEQSWWMRCHWVWWGGFLVVAPAQVASGLGCGPAAPGPPDASQARAGQDRVPVLVRVGTYNVKNLFNDRVDGPNVGGEEIRYTLSSEAYARKLGRLADVLGELGADVVVLQEVENQDVLERLADQAPLRGTYPYRLLVEGNDLRGIDVAVLSHYPVVRHRTHRDDRFVGGDQTGGESYRYARDCLEVHLLAGGRRLILLGVHFKSHRYDDPDRRLAEAQHTRRIADRLTEEYADAGIIIAGDFNDPPGSETLAALGAAPASGGLVGPAYCSVGARLPQPERWTTVDPATQSGVLFDDLLVSPGLYDALDIESVRVLREPPPGEEPEPVSDHAPLVAAFRLDPPWVEP